jgi:hypothetical protein
MIMQKEEWVTVDQRPGYIEFDTPIHIRVVGPRYAILPPNSAPHLRYGPYGFGHAETFANTIIAIQKTRAELEQQYNTRINQLSQTIEDELAAVRTESQNDSVTPLQSINRELNIRSTLIQRKTDELNNKISIANAFYGSDPLPRNFHNYIVQAVKMETAQEHTGLALKALNQSLNAAYDAKVLQQSISWLEQRTPSLVQVRDTLLAAEQAQLAAAQAQRAAAEQALLAAAQEAQRVAAEQALLAAAQEAQRIAAEQAQLAAEQEAQRLAAEQAQQAAEQEAQRIAAEQAQLAAEQEAQRIAAEQAQLAAEQEAQRLVAEQARLEADVQRQAKEKALREAMEAANAAKGVRPFSVSGAAAASGPVFAVAAGTLAVDAATTLAIRAALRTAATVALTASATAIGTASGVLIVVGVAALVYHALKDNEPYAVSFPLSDLTTFDGDDLHAIGKASGEFDLSVAMGSRTTQSTTEFVVAAADGTTVPGKVRVRLATYDPVLNVYRTDLPDTTSSGMTWTPIVGPGNASTALPAEQPNVGLYTGATAKALEGRIDQNPQMDLYTFGGVIYVFPNESGIPPQYVVFRDRRDEPGAATGFGEAVSGVWLESAIQGEGAKIPTQIADKLRGREFPNFRAFREALWKATANDDELSKQFRASNINEMKNGRAPFSRKSDRLGGQEKFQLHHVNQVSKDGAVYDIDNIRVVTPKYHSELHKGDKQ